MGPVRRIINFVVAMTLAVVGCGGLIYLLFFADRFRGVVLMGAATIGVAGLYWLWVDFINADPRPEQD
jgi:hypothetical protein